MADPRTKEELLQEIKNTESENQNYREFKESLTDLNHDIEELMKRTFMNSLRIQMTELPRRIRP